MKPIESKQVLAVGQNEFEWVKEEAIMDSGAFDSFVGMKHVDCEDIKETEASKNEEKYWTACDGSIKNKGEVSIKAQSEEGIPVNMNVQVGDKISNILIAVKNAVKAGNMVIFGADMNAIRNLSKLNSIDEHFVYDKRSGLRTQMYEKQGMYRYPMWVKRRVRKESSDGEDESGWRTPDKKGKISWDKKVQVVKDETECSNCMGESCQLGCSCGDDEWWTPFQGQA